MVVTQLSSPHPYQKGVHGLTARCPVATAQRWHRVVPCRRYVNRSRKALQPPEASTAGQQSDNGSRVLTGSPDHLLSTANGDGGPTLSEGARLAEQWCAVDEEPSSRATVERLVADKAEAKLLELFQGRLKFGTAGLRGLVGPGFTRMNSITVQQTTQGLCAYLRTTAFLDGTMPQFESNGVVVGYDGRRDSHKFALLAAAVFVAQDIPVRLFSTLVPTPFVAAAVSLKGCAAGVMVTASHNPKEYNGYKVYWSNSCQIIPPHDRGIAEAINANLDLWDVPSAAEAAASPLVSDPLQEVQAHYYAALRRQLCFRHDANSSAAPVAYTALHGVGTPWVQQAFEVFGLPPPVLVPEQAQPDPDFPTVAFPNPEEGRGVWALGFATAERAGARLALANDPDADRLAAAEYDPDAGSWRTFSGNEIGILLAHWLWTNRSTGDGRPIAMVSSTVSSKMLAAMAAAEGFHWEETLTGFKWLGNAALRLEAQGYNVLFAFEEAIGFMAGSIVRDKDGVSAAAVFAEMAAHLAAAGSTVAQHLRALRQRYGHFEYRAGYFTSVDPAASRAAIDSIRNDGNYPTDVGSIAVESVRDLGRGLDTAQAGGQPLLPGNPGDLMVTLRLQHGAEVTLRTSGTEPKLKYYLEVQSEDAQQSLALADRLERALAENLVQAKRFNMKQTANE